MGAISVTATSVVRGSGNPKIGTWLATGTAGMALYTDGTRGQYGPSVGPADANGTANLRTCIGVSLNGGAVGQACVYLGDDGDIITFGAGLTANVWYIAGATTPGDINPIADITTGWYLSSIGPAISTSQLVFKPYATGVAS